MRVDAGASRALDVGEQRGREVGGDRRRDRVTENVVLRRGSAARVGGSGGGGGTRVAEELAVNNSGHRETPALPEPAALRQREQFLLNEKLLPQKLTSHVRTHGAPDAAATAP